MKLDQLRKIIREEVRSAIKAELQEVMNEAVRAASAPTTMTAAPVAGNTSWSAPKKELKKQQWTSGKSSTLEEMLNQTANTMSNEEYKNISGTSGPIAPNFASRGASQMGMTENTGPAPGLDLSTLPFLKNAGAIYKASIEKDKEKGRR
jgi:hypothetical protein|tara:strand:+ start:4253 stop:4699 length:447 start_codon:yes stop_codon:yes gene_type:complete